MNARMMEQEEQERLKALYSFQILDTDPDPDFDAIVSLACEVCQSPSGSITLVDYARQWFKARKGIDHCETHRSFSFCSYTIKGDDLLIIPDARNDDRFSENPFVQGYRGIRFYAGVPLITDAGHRIGALCITDVKSRTLTETQIYHLRSLARQVMHLLNSRLRNISLQQQTEQKTQELNHVLNRIEEAFISFDFNWRCTFANRQLGRITNWNPEDLIGKNIWEEFPEAINSPTYHAFHTARDEQKYVTNIDYYAPLKLWLENHIYPTPEGVCAFVRDITHQKNSETRLVESIERLERAEEQARMGSWNLELPDGKRVWSKQMFLLFGFEPADQPPPADEFLQRIHPDDRHLIIKFGEEMMKGNQPTIPILRTNPLKLPLRYLLGHARPVHDKSGKVVRFEGTMSDITELQKTNQELDHFVYSVSHDLRAPLSSILGLLNLMELESLTPSIQNYLQIIRGQVNKLDGFIKDILDYSTNARMDIGYEKIEFPELLTRVQSRFHIQQTDRIKLLIDARVDQFYSDRMRLEIIFNNLYSNSIRYQDQAKETCEIKVTARQTDDWVYIEFTDNGIGIEAAYLDKIFKMFFRASTLSKGSGLGLYIVKEAAEKLGGNIGVISEVQKKTTFVIALPNLRALKGK